jgi:hypothetical protein
LDDPSILYLATLEPVITVLPLGSHYRNHIAVVRESSPMASHTPRTSRRRVEEATAVCWRWRSQLERHLADRPAVVCLLSDPSLVDTLRANPDEVDYVFTHPLRAVLDGRPAEGARGEAVVRGLQPVGGEWWPHEEEFHVREA